jgi:hypothetical protein
VVLRGYGEFTGPWNSEPERTQAVTIHETVVVKLALLHWIDNGMEFDPELASWPLETRGLRYEAATIIRAYILFELRNCPDTLPDSYCDRLQMPSGSTFGQAARKIWREHLGEVEKSAT